MKKFKKNLPVVLLFLAAVIFIFARGGGEESASLQQDAASQLVLITDAPDAVQTAPPQTAAPQETAPPATEPPTDVIEEDAYYTSVEDVSYYLHTYGHLPDNYITKSEAEDAGWEPAEGNLWEVTDGKSIGGDRFGNYEGLLPKGETYRECDVNYDGGYRGDERIIYGSEGSIWYTDNHYESFERLY